VSRVLAVVPVPCDARMVFRVVALVAERWEADHPGRTMTTRHLETRHTEFGPALVVWDEPLPD
jgi:hypothetical protein